jgi:FtsP/CotA-like multicopper oxidase with cupredoxin domain
MGMNGIPHWRTKAIETTIGAVEVWNIVNDTDFSHPFHVHGYFFQVLDDTRVPEWKDTANVPAHSSLRIAIAFDERPGLWMYHCHILDHAERGMMGHLHVRDPASNAPAEHGKHGEHGEHEVTGD